ncbi:hypothetical protein [Arsenicicoccus dermatophilus]|uniref:hypothetical protein n=1 Tax=Arsenicicoccus dermatophilus TaxID=1076331 RepID=UPI001F4C61F9|nr:hypothetical protein [Arsenicicoccus dermatophilus]MCH8612547.1 hypothetical protein [Arsenicicoccus dermatophilus]
MTEGLGGPPPGEPHRCSARGCRADGTWELRWRNPTLHAPDRRKVWLACEDHKEPLSQFLSMRGFLRETEPHRA